MRALLVASATALLATSCSNVAPARRELVVVVDTDMPVFSVVAASPEVSADALIDTVRVEALPLDGATPYDLNTFLAPDIEDWPLSFGVPIANGTTSVRLRIRGFRGDLASPGEQSGVATIDPLAEATIDRVVDLAAPEEGIRNVVVHLDGDCMGVLPSFGASVETCIAGKAGQSPRDGLTEVDDARAVPTRAGTWPGALEVPCTGSPPSGAVCIPGGFTMMGDVAFRGVADFSTFDSYPVHPVRLSPYFLDVTELSVGRLRALVAEGFAGALPHPKDDPDVDYGEFCTWTGSASDANDALPVNCIRPDDAAAICEAMGGFLPSEAQWEHAARGRGQGRLFPWGDADPSCCLTSASRKGPDDVPTECEGSGIEPVGSHPATCPGGLGDVSRDGVLDLAGSVEEAMRDGARSFDAGCWSEGGVRVDPVCTDDAPSRSSRGSFFSGGFATTAAPWRRIYALAPTSGFRCAYADGGS